MKRLVWHRSKLLLITVDFEIPFVFVATFHRIFRLSMSRHSKTLPQP
jgi:hypothetical protein